MIEYLNGIVVEIQSRQIRSELKQVSVQRVDLVVAEVQGLQRYVAVLVVSVRSPEYLSSKDFA